MANQNEPNLFKKIVTVAFLLSFCLLLVTFGNASASTSDHSGDDSDGVPRNYVRPAFQSGIIFNFKFDGLFDLKNYEVSSIELKYTPKLDIQFIKTPAIKLNANFEDNALKNIGVKNFNLFPLDLSKLNPINIIDKFTSNLNSNPSSTWSNPFPSLDKKSLDSGILYDPLWKFSDSNTLSNHGSSWSDSGSNLLNPNSGASSSSLDTDWNFKSNLYDSFNSNNFNSNPLDDNWGINSHSITDTYKSSLNSINLNSNLNSNFNWP